MRIAALYHKAACLFGGPALLQPGVEASQRARLAALDRIHALELTALRALREHALGEPSAIGRVRAIDDQIVEQRAVLTAINATLGPG